MSRHHDTTFDRARDELFSQIHRCHVLQATPEQQAEWLRDTADYLGETFPSLSDRQLDELRELGERFCQPAIPHGKGYTELSREEWQEEEPEEATAQT